MTEDPQLGKVITDDTTTDPSSDEFTAGNETDPTSSIITVIKLIMMVNKVKLVLYTIYGILIIISNLMTIISVLKFKSLRSPPDILVGSLAAADLLQAFPLLTYSLISKIGNDTIVKVAAGFLVFFNSASITVSLWAILAIAMDR